MYVDQRWVGEPEADPNETNGALNQTVSRLQGGVVRVGIASAILIIASWERTLAATARGLPIAVPLAQPSLLLNTGGATLGGQARG